MYIKNLYLIWSVWEKGRGKRGNGMVGGFRIGEGCVGWK